MQPKNRLVAFVVTTVAFCSLFMVNHVAGEEWTAMGSVPTTETLYAVWGTSGSDVFAAGGLETILHFNGSSWVEQNVVANGVVLRDVRGNSGSNVYAVGGNGTIYHYDGTWSLVSDINTSADLNGVWVSANGEVFIVGAQPPTGGTAVILHYTGSSWEVHSSGTAYTLNAVWGASENDVFAVGENGTILKYDGSTWAPMTNPGTSPLTAVWGNSASDVFACGATNILHYDGNAGDIWTAELGVVDYPNGLWGTSDSDIYAVGGSDNRVIEYFDGNSWGVQYNPSAYPYGVWGSSAYNVFVVGGGGLILNKRLEAGMHPPVKPTGVAPPIESIFSGENPITLKSSAFDDPDGSSIHYQTQWKIMRADTGAAVNPIISTTDLTQYIIGSVGLTTGLKYAWQVRYVDDTGLASPWSDTFSFKVGTSEPDSLPPIAAGEELGDFGMASIVHWPDNPDPRAVFNIDYDPANYRIGTYDAVQGRYIEFGKGLKMEPGRAYWILAREGLTVNFSGIPVSKEFDIDVKLGYNPTTQNGWNMVAPPNDARYYWGDVQVVVYDANGAIIFGPQSILFMDGNNPYIDLRIWCWENAVYHSYNELLMEPYQGYWVKAQAGNVFLRFPYYYQAESSALEKTAWARLLNKAKQWARDVRLSVREALAGDDAPPMPMGEFEDRVDPVFEGCFVGSAGR
ncbi:MAG: hypothetical protein LJE94_03145 [Deltaproteobacteria bacterium]|nr:hypothetical protein [Deltaproteobacteria bacterium]